MAVIKAIDSWKPHYQLTWIITLISIKKCKEILNQYGRKFSEKKIKALRSRLYELANIIKKIKPKTYE